MNNEQMLEKYIDLTQYGAEYDIYKYLANGWYIHYQGLTLIILRKGIEQ
jgi:hypothetical protein